MHAELLLDDRRQLGRGPPVAPKTRCESSLVVDFAKLSELIRPLARYSQSGEINFPVGDKDARIRELAERYKKDQIDYLDGLTIDAGEWWFNLRKGNTEPLLRLNVEARTAGMLEEKLAELKKLLGEAV